MPPRALQARLALALVLAAVAVPLACTDSGSRTEPITFAPHPGTGGDPGIGAGGGAALTDAAADAPDGIDAGQPEVYPLPDPRCAAFPEGPCGDGILNCGEACDGNTFFQDTCEAYGFTGGTLTCTATCTVDKSGCRGTEICDDWMDNDGNGRIDCADPACRTTCGDSCDQAVALVDPGSVSDTTSGNPDSRDPSCASPTGAEAVYVVTAATTGTMTATVSSAAFMGLSFRRTCEDVTTELGCGLGPVSISVTAGEVLFLVVEPFEPNGFGGFDLHVETTP